MSVFLRWTLRLLGGLLLLLLLLGGTLYVVGSRAVTRTYDVEPVTAPLPTDSASLAHGHHVAQVMGCYDCHGDRLQGAVMGDDPPFRVTAPNLTPAGVTSTYTTADWYRSIRHGIGPDGRPLLVMPSSAFQHLSNRDASALIAYLQTVEPVENDVPPTRVKAFGRVLAGLGAVNPAAEVAPSVEPSEPVAWAASVAFGRYVAAAACGHCHGSGLQGQPSPDPNAPYAPSLFASGKWRFESFRTLMRTGIHPNGNELDPTYMPWSAFRHFTDDELRGIHMHLATLAPPEPDETARP